MVERDYQTYAVNRAFDYLYTATGNGVIVMPTGTGKSHVISGIVQRALYERPNATIHMLTHVKELIEQNLEKLQEAWPQAPVGVFSAGLGKKQNNMPVIYGGVKSMMNAIDDLPTPDLTLIDECHLFSPNAEAMYGEYHRVMRERNPYLRSIGTTATDWRLGQGRLTDPGSFFTDTIVNMANLQTYNWFVEQGYLVPLIPKPMETHLDTTGIGMSGGDLNMSQVQKAVDRESITRAALAEAMHYGYNRRKWLAFASGVDHADHISEMLNTMGIRATVVHRGVPKEERRERIKAFKRGEYRCIVNNNILTTGFDDIGIDLILCLRPTLSSALWVQMLGRGTRPWYALGFDLSTQQGRLLAIANSPKQNCLVLDFAHNTGALGPINDPVIPKKAGGAGGDAPVKICETRRLVHRDNGVQGCGAYNHTTARHCINCGAEFDFAVNFDVHASIQALVSDGADEFEWFNVQNVFYSKQIGPSGKPYLRVDYYYTSKKKFSDYVQLEQTKWVLHQAHEWWKARALHPSDWGVPPTVDDALKVTNGYLKQPKRIRVWVNKQPIPEVVNYEYE